MTHHGFCFIPNFENRETRVAETNVEEKIGDQFRTSYGLIGRWVSYEYAAPGSRSSVFPFDRTELYR